jgi:hypothetical protein
MFGKQFINKLSFGSLLILGIFFLVIQGCNPIEAISDTFSGIVDEVSSEDDDGDLIVGQVLTQASFTTSATVSFSITVLSKAGSLIKDDTLVNCRYTRPSTGAVIIEFEESTVSGLVSCGLTNDTSTREIALNFIATAEGVSSDVTSITLPAGVTA